MMTFYGVAIFSILITTLFLIVLWFMRGPSATLFRARFVRGGVIVLVEDDTGVLHIEIAKWKDKSNVLETNKKRFSFLPRLLTIPDRRRKMIEVHTPNPDNAEETFVEKRIVDDETADEYEEKVEKVNEWNDLIKRRTGLAGLNKPVFLAHASSCIASNVAVADEMEDVKVIDKIVKRLGLDKVKNDFNIRFTSVTILKEMVHSSWSPTDIKEVRSEAYVKGTNINPDKGINPLVIGGGIIGGLVLMLFVFLIVSKGNLI